jgi:ABC-type anion transport system duplicated permease subunit
MTGVDVAVFLGVGAGGIGTVVASAAGADPGGQLSIGLASAAAAMLAFVVWLLRRLDERAASARLETTAILTKLVADKEDQIVSLKAEIRDLRRELGKDDT